MAQKNATPTKEQKAVLERHKLNPLCWVVVNETPAGTDRQTTDYRRVPADQQVTDCHTGVRTGSQ